MSKQDTLRVRGVRFGDAARLPVYLTPLIGRDREVGEVAGLLRARRHVSLHVGIGFEWRPVLKVVTSTTPPRSPLSPQSSGRPTVRRRYCNPGVPRRRPIHLLHLSG